MKIIVVKDSIEGGREGFKVFKEALDNGAKVFGLATGSTPETTYAQIVDSDLDFSKCTSINLDEYVGLGANDPQSYHYFMNQHLFSKKPFAHSYLPDGLAKNAKKETARYDALIEKNPIDLQLLGIGQNGHIGFNEPGSSFDGKTQKIRLTESTIEANSRFFENEDQVPKYAYSMGIGSIMKAKKILLEAYGPAKAEVIRKMVKGPITEDVPASILQRHQDVVVIADEAAAALLRS
ncbi:glucosamine-6-phosphate deaminase [Ligilactobacillus sp. Marseille-Q7487]|uniref:glucosamine-6-phosphate deaminase n=1 Tax=Ligilactobacillus sp. Marseille-Q7487 TaxID=3022128 RepID=UPI0015B38E2E|nr:glucosamine-6-phosphate deaminase [Ligilactobacillus sp. Marseille-Q7487]